MAEPICDSQRNKAKPTFYWQKPKKLSNQPHLPKRKSLRKERRLCFKTR